jgi:hypothetical protein
MLSWPLPWKTALFPELLELVVEEEKNVMPNKGW